MFNLSILFGSRRSTLSSLNSKRELKDQIRRARILVVDDDVNAFPVELLKAEGYNVTYWSSIKTFAPLENGDFDIIVLDLNGIASAEQSSEDGTGILRHIKAYNPAQIVIAYSAKKYDFRKSDFWRLADDYLGKPSPLDACKQKIDELLQSKYNVDYYWSVLRSRLVAESVSEKQILKLESLIVQKSQNGKSFSLDEFASVIKLGKEALSASFVVITIIGKILKDGGP